MADFTVPMFRKLLESLVSSGIPFFTFRDYVKQNPSRAIILRHDVDLLPVNALILATLEHQMGISGTYYFRIVPESFDEVIITKISHLGHEIGYHYEDINLMAKNQENMDNINSVALSSFRKNLEKFRSIVPVETICMHGSPMGKLDNRILWNENNYRMFGISGEPYFDVDFSKVLYLTDTGRRWDGHRFSIRDKMPEHISRWRNERLEFHSTGEIIKAADEGRLPDMIMMTVHPQRWSSEGISWMREYLLQNAKNIVKYCYSRMSRS
jgi:hypothetical protein